MGYGYTANNFIPNDATWQTVFSSVLQTAGWEVWDNATADGSIVLRSDGEAGGGVYCYVRIFTTGTWIYPYWNNVTHDSTAPYKNAWGTGRNVGPSYGWFIYASKDGFLAFVHSAGSVGSTNIACLVHASEQPANAWRQTTTADVTLPVAGTNKTGTGTISVQDASQFIVGARYVMFDPTGGKRNSFLVSARDTTNNTISTVTALTGTYCGGTYPTGSYIGTSAYPWACLTTDKPIKMFAGGFTGNAVDYDDGSNNTVIQIGYAAVTNTPSSASPGGANAWVSEACPAFGVLPNSLNMSPARFHECSGGNDTGECYHFFHGYVPFINIIPFITSFFFEKQVMGNLDVVTDGVIDSGTSTGSNTNTVLNDTSKTWVANAYTGKILVMTSGNETGQVRKILSNTVNSVTVDSMYIIPGTCTYVICDEAYRAVSGGSGNSILRLLRNDDAMLLKEGVDGIVL